MKNPAMPKKIFITMLIFVIAAALIQGCSFTNKPDKKDLSHKNEYSTQDTNKVMPDKLDTAVFGAGCFWCTEAIYERLKGVESVEAGYSGGKVANPSYEEVCTGTTGHAEVARIIFDPTVISYDRLLDVFWTVHDPTTLNRQGADVGTQYRSVIFYLNDKQKQEAEKSKKEVAPTIWDDPIVTEISPLINFYKAEDYHQEYYDNNPGTSYCQFVINPKVQKFKKKFKDWLK
jgi:peptide-methionine (S)-S-oxide reductase